MVVRPAVQPEWQRPAGQCGIAASESLAESALPEDLGGFSASLTATHPRDLCSSANLPPAGHRQQQQQQQQGRPPLQDVEQGQDGEDLIQQEHAGGLAASAAWGGSHCRRHRRVPHSALASQEVQFGGQAAAAPALGQDAAGKPARWTYHELLDARRAAALAADAWRQQQQRRERQQLELMWPMLCALPPACDSGQPLGGLKRWRVQHRWGVRLKRQHPSQQQGRPKSGDSADDGGKPKKRRCSNTEELRQQQPQQEKQQPQQRRRRRRQQAGSNWRQSTRLQQCTLPSPVPDTADGGAAVDGPAAREAAAAAGQVPFPLVPGVPAGLVQQLALLPAGRLACGSCAACEAAVGKEEGGGRGCQVLAALRCWDALLPGLSLPELQQLRQSQEQCKQCRDCLRAAHAGGDGKKRRGHAAAGPCLALSRVRGRADQVQQKLEKLKRERVQWAAAQQQQQQGAGAARVGGAAAAGVQGMTASQPSALSDSEDSNRSRLWLWDQRRHRSQQLYMQPLPAPDASLPLPLVPGVPWRRLCELEEEWGDGQPPRCGVCPSCRGLQQQQEAEGMEDEAGSAPAEPDVAAAPRCAAAAGLAAWDRLLGPVTAAAASAVAALPLAQQHDARCGCCRQCTHPAPAGKKQQPCATARKLKAGTLPERLKQVATAAQQQAQQGAQPGGVAASPSSAAAAAAAASPSTSGRGVHSSSSDESIGASSHQTSSHSRGSGRWALSGGRSRSCSSMYCSDTGTSGTSTGSDNEPSGGAGGSKSDSSGGNSCSDSEDEDARWLPWVTHFLPTAQQEQAAADEAVLAAAAASGHRHGRDDGDGYSSSSGGGGDGSGSDKDAGTNAEEAAELAAARLLVRRQRDRELLQCHGRASLRHIPRWGVHRQRASHSAATHRLRLMLAEARCLAAELGVPLAAVTDWRCIARVPIVAAPPPRSTGGSDSPGDGAASVGAARTVECGNEHGLRRWSAGWHLWQCFRCGAPRWEGPGWQLQQRLAAALQAGAALGGALLPPHGGDAPMAAAGEAAAAALARFRREAACAVGSGGGSAALPDAARAAAAGASRNGGSSGDDSAALVAAAAAAGLPSFESGDKFRSLAELTASMLAESRRALEGGTAAAVERQRLTVEQRCRCREMRRSDLGRATLDLESAAMGLVEEQQALLAQQQQRRQQQQQQWQRREEAAEPPSAFDRPLAQARQQQSLAGLGPHLLLLGSQHGSQPPSFMSQAGDNMGPAAEGSPAFVASRQASPHAITAAAAAACGAGSMFLFGTEASQPDPTQPAALLAQQQAQCEVLPMRRQQQQEQQQGPMPPRQTPAGEAPPPDEQQLRQRERLRERQLAGASEATYHNIWYLLEHLLRGLLEQHGAQAQDARGGRQHKAQQGSSGKTSVRLRLPPPPMSRPAVAVRSSSLLSDTEQQQSQQQAWAWPGQPSAAQPPGPTPPAGRTAWHPGVLAAADGRGAALVQLPPAPPRPQQAALLRLIPRFKPLSECQPRRVLQQRTLAALLPVDALPGFAASPPTAGAQRRFEAAAVRAQDLAEQTRLVAAHPQLLLLLQHPRLLRCGHCNTCTSPHRPQHTGRKSGSRNCLLYQRFANHARRQLQQELEERRGQQRQRRRRDEVDDEEAAGGTRGGSAGGGNIKVLTGVPEADGLRAAAAFKLLHPTWRPAFLTSARLAAVAAALPAAVAALHSNGTQKQVPRGFELRQWEHLQHLLSLLRGEELAGAAGEQQPTQQLITSQKQQQQQQEHRQVLAPSARSAFQSVPSQHLASASACPLKRQQLRQQLLQLPQDVQLVFRVGLSLLPPAAVAALVQGYHSITGTVAVPMVQPQPPAHAPPSSPCRGIGKNKHRRASPPHDASGTSSEPSSVDDDDDEDLSKPCMTKKRGKRRRQ